MYSLLSFLYKITYMCTNTDTHTHHGNPPCLVHFLKLLTVTELCVSPLSHYFVNSCVFLQVALKIPENRDLVLLAGA